MVYNHGFLLIKVIILHKDVFVPHRLWWNQLYGLFPQKLRDWFLHMARYKKNVYHNNPRNENFNLLVRIKFLNLFSYSYKCGCQYFILLTLKKKKFMGTEVLDFFNKKLILDYYFCLKSVPVFLFQIFIIAPFSSQGI